MTRPLYDFLADSIFFDEEQLAESYASIPGARLEKELEKYREHVDSQINEIQQELLATDHGELSICFDTASRTQAAVPLLKQCVLYFDHMIIDDPLYGFSSLKYSVDKTMDQYLGFKENGIDRESLAQKMRLAKSLSVAVAEGIVSLFRSA